MLSGSMKKVMGTAVISVMLFSVVAFAADKRAKKPAPKKASRLVANLPASDAIAVVNAKRFFSEMLPMLTSVNAGLIGEMMAALNEFESKTGIRLQQFDEVVVGVTYVQDRNGKVNYEPVVVAGGSIDRVGIVNGLAKAPIDSVERRSIAGRDAFVFKPKVDTSKMGDASAKVNKLVEQEMAIAFIDDATMVAGPLASVERSLTKPASPDAAVNAALAKRSSAMMSFAMAKPPALTNLLPAELDDLGKNVASINMLFGSIDLAASGMQLDITARTGNAKDARDLRQTLVDMQGVGKALLGRSKRADQQMYTRFLNAARFDAVGNDVSMSMVMSRDDVSTLVNMLAK